MNESPYFFLIVDYFKKFLSVLVPDNSPPVDQEKYENFENFEKVEKSKCSE